MQIIEFVNYINQNLQSLICYPVFIQTKELYIGKFICILSDSF